MKIRCSRLFFWLTAFFYFWSYYFKGPVQLSYAMEFGATGAALGMINSISNLVSVVFMPLAAWLSGRFSTRKIIVSGFGLQLAAFYITWAAQSALQVGIGNFLNGICFAVTIVYMASIAVSIYPPELSGAVLSIYTMLQALCQGAANSLGLWAAGIWGYRFNFFVSLLLSGFCFLFCLCVTDYGDSQAQDSPPAAQPSKIPAKVWPLLLLGIFCGMIVCAVQSYTEPFAKLTGNTAGLELFFSFYAGTMGIIRLCLAGAIKRLSLRKALLCLSSAIALAMLCIQIQARAWALWLGAVLTALGIGLLQTLTQYQVFACFPPNGKSQASSLFYMCLYGGMMVGNFTGSLLFTSPAGPIFFFLCALLALFPAALTALLGLQKGKRQKRPVL